MLRKDYKKFVYLPTTPIKRVLGELYRSTGMICMVTGRDGKLRGIVTISDLKVAMMKGVDPAAPISRAMNTEFRSAKKGTSLKKLAKIAASKNPLGTGPVRNVPIVDSAGRIAGLYSIPLQNGVRSTVLVTGGAGYIGSILCRMLLEKNYKVIVLDKLLFGDIGVRELKRHKHFQLIKGDIGDIGTLVRAAAGVDAIVHLAGIVGDPASSLNPMQTLEKNQFATKALIDISKYYQVERFVFASSCSVYGTGPRMLNEKSPLHPVSLYAQSKLYSERDLLHAAGKDFHPIILRFGTIYGLSPRMRFDLVGNTMTANAYFNKEIQVQGGDQWRPLLHVADAARSIVCALEAPLGKVDREIFSVGSTKENYRIKDVAEHVKKQVPTARIKVKDLVQDRRDYRVDFSKAAKVLGFKNAYTLDKGIRELASAFRAGKFRDWRDPVYSNYLTLKISLEQLYD